MTPEEKLQQMGVTLEPVEVGSNPLIPWVHSDKFLFLSGTTAPNGKTGQVGNEVSTEEAYDAARQCALRHLAVVKSALGDLSKVKRVVKVLGMVNSAAGYGDQPKVINGYSECLVEVFGEEGRHARSAVGMAGLPGNACVEVEVIFEVE